MVITPQQSVSSHQRARSRSLWSAERDTLLRIGQRRLRILCSDVRVQRSRHVRAARFRMLILLLELPVLCLLARSRRFGMSLVPSDCLSHAARAHVQQLVRMRD